MGQKPGEEVSKQGSAAQMVRTWWYLHEERWPEVITPPSTLSSNDFSSLFLEKNTNQSNPDLRKLEKKKETLAFQTGAPKPKV